MTGRATEDNRRGLTAVRLVHGLVAVVLVAIGIETWLVAGLLVPLVVEGGSMAPTLKGAHRGWTCADCRREFVCGLESLPDAGLPAVCPWCHAAQTSDDGVDRPADRVLVLRGALAGGAPRRWDMVALHSPEPGGEMCVKRVVGLPGERIEIRAGNVWVDGQMAHKSLDEQRAMAVLVDDMSGASAAAGACRWRDNAGHWRFEDAQLTHAAECESPGEPIEEIHWLEFIARPWLSDDGSDVETARRTVMDESPYDQNESRTLNPVRDLLVHGVITSRGAGELWLRGQMRGANILVRLDLASGQVSLKYAGRVRQFQTKLPVDDRPCTFDWLLAEGQVRLAIDGNLVVEFADEAVLADGVSGDEPPAADGLCLAIGARGADVTLGDLQVWRDVYYTAPRSADRLTEYRLGPDEYLVLGDNSAHSQDSRGWQPGPVPASLIVGRVVRW